MRTRHVLGASLLGLGLVASMSAACGDKKGAIMLAINTDMKAPKDVNAVSVTISADSRIIHSAIGRVTPQGEILLPASLAIAEGDNPSASIRIRVMAFQETKARVLRDVRTNIPKGGRVALMRIPLNFANDASSKGDPLPPGVLPDPFPGTGGTTGTPDGGTSSGVPTSAGEFDFLTQFQSTCQDPFTQTVIDGECKDSYVDPETLPDFDPSVLGNSEDPGSCFDVVKCFAGATPIAQGAVGGETGTDRPPSGSGDSDGKPVPPGGSSGSSGSSGGGGADAGGGAGFKNVTPRALAFDVSTCTIALNGASAARLNLALVTPETGECVRPNECYVPIDRGPGGWRDEGGIVRLPKFVCALVNKGAGIRLAQTTDVCAAKQENNPICAPKKGDVPDGGPAAGVQLLAAFDFPSTVVFGDNEFGFAGAEGGRIGSILKSPPEIRVINGIPSEKRPWRITLSRQETATVTNGTATAYTVSGGEGEATTRTITVAPDTHQGIAIAASLLWGVASKDGQGGVYASSQAGGSATKLTFLQQAPPNATALYATERQNTFIVGELSGAVRGCSWLGVNQVVCAAPQALGSGRVDAIIDKPGDPNSGYVLTSTVVAYVGVNGETGQISSKVALPEETAGITDATGYYARGLAAGNRCVYFSSSRGLEWAEITESRANTGLLVPRLPGGEILGVALGSTIGKEGAPRDTVYFAVFAPKSAGGGIYFTQEPPQCRSASSGDGGTGSEAGADALPPPKCTEANCADGCCIGGPSGDCIRPGAGSPAADTHCGLFGKTCVNCTATGLPFCDGAGMCTGG